MKKLLILALAAFFCTSALSAGDVATFVDKGFSEDGKYYVLSRLHMSEVPPENIMYSVSMVELIKNFRDGPKYIR